MSEKYLQHPRDQKFYNFLTLAMSYSSLCDRPSMGYEKPSKLAVLSSTIMIYFGPVTFFSQVFYFYVNFRTLKFDTVAIIFSVLPGTFLANVNLLSSKLKTYKRLMASLFTGIHLYTVYEKRKEDKFVKNTLRETERYSRWTSFYITFLFFTIWLNWMCIPAIRNFNNKELVLNHTFKLQTCVYLWLPIDYTYNFEYWYWVHTINVYLVACGVTVMALVQSMTNIFIYNIIGHIKILKNMLRTEFGDDLSEAECKKKLVDVIEYHLFITRVFKDIEFAFGFNVIANYAQNLVGNSITLYQITYGGKESIPLYVPMVFIYTGGPVIMSFILEEIKKQADDLPDIVYDLPWENMSIPNQKTVILLLQRVQSVLEFTALGMLIAGVKPMVSILKTTFSYYVMLKSTVSTK